jgi:hypothetical protein
MPSSPRIQRPLVALLLVVSLLASGSAGSALAGQPTALKAADRTVGAIAHTAPTVARTADYDRGPSLRNGLLSGRASMVVSSETAVAATVSPASRVHLAGATPKAKVESKSKGSTAKGSSDSGATPRSSLHGRNHMWMPALHIDRSVSFYSCSNNAYPGNRVYKWGCAGRNNVYLFGHASSVFKSLHDAYVRGRLAKGMKLYYADGNGKVSTYKVAWWKLTTPDKGAFAFASLSRPSVTLQTCIGAKNQYRLIVRLYKVG